MENDIKPEKTTETSQDESVTGPTLTPQETIQSHNSSFKDAIKRVFSKYGSGSHNSTHQPEKSLNDSIAESNPRPPISFIEDKRVLPIMQDVASELGLKFEVVASEGEEYSIDNGDDGLFSGPVPENKAFVRVSGQGSEGLTPFWTKTDLKRKRLSVKK